MLSMRSCSALIALVFMPVLGLFLLSAPAYAQSTKPQNGADLIKYSPLNPLPGVAMDTTQPDALATYLGEIYTFIVGFIIIIAFLAFTYGGFQYVLSTTVGSKSEAKTYMVGALAGLVIALASYLILYTINPQLLNFNFITEFQQISVGVPQTPGTVVTMCWCPAGATNQCTPSGGTFTSQADCIAATPHGSTAGSYSCVTGTDCSNGNSGTPQQNQPPHDPGTQRFLANDPAIQAKEAQFIADCTAVHKIYVISCAISQWFSCTAYDYTCQ